MILITAAFIMLAIGRASAAEKPVIAFSQTAGTDGSALPIDAVTTYTKGSKIYAFLPGAWTGSDIHLWFTGAEEATVDGNTVKSGDIVPVTAERMRIVINRKTYDLNILRGSAIPVLFIRTESGSLENIEASKENKETGELLMLNEKGGQEYAGALKYVKMRGNMSTRFLKKNYGIKLETGTDLLGFGKAKRWVLTGNNRDHSLLRNQITFEMARYTGMAYTPDCAQTDLYINNEYRGTYLLSDKIEINGGRVEIDSLEDDTEAVNDMPLENYAPVGPTEAEEGRFKAWNIPHDPADITGGYLVEFEEYASRYTEEDSAYMTVKGNILAVKSPEYASIAQMTYITELMQSFENAIFNAEGIDLDTGRHYSEIADVPSMAMKFMVEEISKNYDGSNSSQFFYKMRDSVSMLLYAGPVWDYDSAYGSYGHKGGEGLLKPTGFSQTYVTKKNDWWAVLYHHKDFRAVVRELWQSRFRQALLILAGEAPEEGGLRSIDSYAEDIRSSAEMNFIRWPMKTSSTNIANTGKTFQANVDFMRRFISKRCAWLDKQWGSSK